VGQVTAVLNTGLAQLFQRILGITHPMNHDATVSHCPDWCDQKFLKLARAFLVAPVADPQKVNLTRAPERLELFNVCGLVKSPCSRHPEPVSINAQDGLAKGEYAIHQMQMKFQDLTSTSVRAVMTVMEQRNKAELLLQCQNGIDHRRLVPLMQQHYISTLEFRF